MINTTEYEKFIEVQFGYKAELVSAIKEIPGRRFNPDKKVWTVPWTSKDHLVAFISKYTKQPVNGQPQVRVHTFNLEPLPELEIELPLKLPLYHYQGQGVAYNLKHKRVIIGDEPGLGKTGQSIASVLAAGQFPCLVICPASLKKNWVREWNKWTNKKAYEMTDGMKKTWPLFINMNTVDVFVTNYESLKKFFINKIEVPIDAKTGKQKPLRANHITARPDISLFKSVIIDEVHRCKDGKTQQAKFVMKITSDKEMVLALTGTPVVNRSRDLIAQLHIINQLDALGGYKYFVDRFGGGQNLQELNWLLNKFCFYRRLKKDVLKELPDKVRQIVRCEITNRDEYTKAENNFKKYLRENLGKTEGEINRAMRGEIMVQMGLLRQIAAKGKFENAAEVIDEVIESGEKIVVFAHHKAILDRLHEMYPDAVTITGEDNQNERQTAVDAFQCNPRVQIILCSIKAAGVGITLTASSRVLFMEFPWTAADCDQCEDRTHRIGQKNSVQATYLLGLDTIDEHIYKIIEHKRTIAAGVTGDTDLIATNFIDDFVNLFNS